MRNRLTHTFATKLCVQAVDAVFLAMGGSALGMHHPVQRFWRDIHAASSHISLNWDRSAPCTASMFSAWSRKGNTSRDRWLGTQRQNNGPKAAIQRERK